MALLCLMMTLAGCSAQAGRYQLATNAAGNTLWRLDTWTGEMDACGFESGKPVCRPFPGPSSKK
jgi:hypothetical protein